MKKILFSLLIALASVGHVSADVSDAVVKVSYSLGKRTTGNGTVERFAAGSAVVIFSEPNKTVLLSAAHVYSHVGQTNIELFAPHLPANPPQGDVQIKVVALDKKADLALLVMNVGPLPKCVAWSNRLSTGKDVVSVGYADGKKPAKIQRTVITNEHSSGITYTRLAPFEGMSGGALIDASTGDLVGICSARDPNGRFGVYASHDAVISFLKTNRFIPDLEQAIAAAPAPKAIPPGGEKKPQTPGVVHIPREERALNDGRGGGSCGWAATQTVINHERIKEANYLLKEHGGGVNPGDIERVLKRKGVEVRTIKGRKQLEDAIAQGYPVVGFVPGHVIVITGVRGNTLRIVENNHGAPDVERPFSYWQGYGFILWVPKGDAPEMKPLTTSKPRPQVVQSKQPNIFNPQPQARPTCPPGGG